jgi:hypothetical protein
VINDKDIELVNRSIDGETTPEENERLAGLLASDSEVRLHHEELLALDGRMRSARQLDVPDGLRDQIMCGIRPRARRVDGGKSRATAWLGELLPPRLAYAFAAGVAAGIALLALITGIGHTPLETQHLSGTISPWDVPAEGGECLEFDVPSGWGSGCISYAGDRIWAEVNLDTTEETKVLFTLGDEVHFDRFRVLEAGEHSISVAGERTELTHTGVGEYILLFEDDGGVESSIGLAVYAGDKLQFEKIIRPRRG